VGVYFLACSIFGRRWPIPQKRFSPLSPIGRHNQAARAPSQGVGNVALVDGKRGSFRAAGGEDVANKLALRSKATRERVQKQARTQASREGEKVQDNNGISMLSTR